MSTCKPPSALLSHVSASQVKSYRECPRKWAWQKLWRTSVPETAAMRVGKELHAQLEHYYREGAEPESPIARAALDVAPPLGAGRALAEIPLEEPEIVASGVPWLGYIDLCVIAPGAAPLVLDWKTTSDFRWAKTPEQLRVDPQAVAYARWAALRFYGDRAFEYHPDARVDVAFVYTLTRGQPRAKRVDVPFAVRELAAPWAAIEADVAAMLALAEAAPTPEQIAAVPANWSACSAYGGCPHRAGCSADRTGEVSLSDRLFQIRPSKGTDTMSNDVSLSSLFDGNNDAGKKAAAAIFGDAPNRNEPGDGLTLYIDCLPTRGAGEVRHLDDVIAERSHTICTEREVADLRLLKFAEGKGLLAASLRANPPRGAFVARSGELSDVAIEALRPLASTIIEGVR